MKQRGEIEYGAWVVGYDSIGDLWATVDIDGFDAFCDAFDACSGEHRAVQAWVEAKAGKIIE